MRPGIHGGPGIVHDPGVGPGAEPGVGGQPLLLTMVTSLLARTLLAAPGRHGPGQLAHLPVI